MTPEVRVYLINRATLDERPGYKTSAFACSGQSYEIKDGLVTVLVDDGSKAIVPLHNVAYIAEQVAP